MDACFRWRYRRLPLRGNCSCKVRGLPRYAATRATVPAGALQSATGEIPAMSGRVKCRAHKHTKDGRADPLRQASQRTDLITRRPTSHRVNFAGSSESTTPVGGPG